MKTVHSHPFAILDTAIPITQYTPIDLSVANHELQHIAITDPLVCEYYITSYLKEVGGKVAYGGYLEQRNLYNAHAGFTTNEQRNIHLGVDFWAPVDTKVRVPLKGRVHSFNNNAKKGDYGPTIILEHQWKDSCFYTLYGHLSLASLDGLHKDKFFDTGQVLGALGSSDINVDYAPHLHFQLIEDMGDYAGDYPGVCAKTQLEFYKTNCPDPMPFLGW